MIGIQGLYSLSEKTAFRQISRSHEAEIGCYNDRIALKLDRHLGSGAAIPSVAAKWFVWLHKHVTSWRNVYAISLTSSGLLDSLGSFRNLFAQPDIRAVERTVSGFCKMVEIPTCHVISQSVATKMIIPTNMGWYIWGGIYCKYDYYNIFIYPIFYYAIVIFYILSHTQPCGAVVLKIYDIVIKIVFEII